jgi:hypothetical protein
MFTKPTETNKALIFSALVLLMALVAASAVGWATPLASFVVLVNRHPVGDLGVLILVGAVIGAIWLNLRLMRSAPDEPRPDVASGHAPAA